MLEYSTLPRQTREALIMRARQMRQSPTPAETLLWQHLRKSRLAGYKFRRQHIIETFIVDFYCPAGRLVVEIDGGIHENQKDYDQIRETDLREMGYQVIRFENDIVLRKTHWVLKEILTALSSSITLQDETR
jgi:very-short-patch-repair endonuclease